MKNDFYYTLNILNKILNNSFRNGKQTIAIHIFPSILRSKGNQMMKFGGLTEYNMRTTQNKSYTKCGGGTFPRPSSKKSIYRMSLDQ